MPTTFEQSVHKHFLEKDLFFGTKVDKLLKWMPFAAVYVLDLLGIETRSSWRKQVVITATTEAIRFLVVDNLKKITHERRPSPYFDHHSFPSGDAASSFAGAEFIHQELKKSHTLLSYAGYIGATGVGIIRLMKSKHWLKDVVAGAIIGIAATKLAYAIVNKVDSKINLPGVNTEGKPANQNEKTVNIS